MIGQFTFEGGPADGKQFTVDPETQPWVIVALQLPMGFAKPSPAALSTSHVSEFEYRYDSERKTFVHHNGLPIRKK